MTKAGDNAISSAVATALAAVVLVTVLASSSAAQSPPPQHAAADATAIVVGARTLTGRHAVPQVQGGRTLLPVAAIARALGDVVTIDVAGQRVAVRRADGVTAEFLAPLGQVRENGVPVLALSDASEILFAAVGGEVLLPAEVVAALLDVSVVHDPATRTIRIARLGATASGPRPGAKHNPLALVEAEYASTVEVDPNHTTHATGVRVSGPLGDGAFAFDASLAGGTGRGLLDFRHGLLEITRPGGQRFLVGDFGTGGEISFLAQALRGVMVSTPFGPTRFTAFAGRTLSDPLPRAGAARAAGEARYDTTVAGGTATWGSLSGGLQGAAGLTTFDGPRGTGTLVAASLRSATARNLFDAEAGFGWFRGTGPDGREEGGVAPLVDVSDTFNVSPTLTVQARLAHIGASYRHPQGYGVVRPSTTVSVGAAWQAAYWLGASIYADAQTLHGDRSGTRRSITAAVRVSPGPSLPSVYAVHTRATNSERGPSSFTLVTAEQRFKGWRLFTTLIRNHTSPIRPATWSATTGASVPIGDASALTVRQTMSSGGGRGGSVDFASSILQGRLAYSAGFEYLHGAQQAAFMPRVRLASALPWGQTLQLSLLHTPDGNQFALSLAGPLLPGTGTDATVAGRPGIFDQVGSVAGRVYHDVNMNGDYEPAIDRPLPNVALEVDSTAHAITDGDGLFRVDHLPVGPHAVAVDLLTVRADLTFLSEPAQQVPVELRQDTVVDFRLVRTGRVSGVVWLDENGNGLPDPDEPRLGGVRVVAAGGRDTMTDGDGSFVLGDLPPGEQAVVVDAKTLPAGMRAAAGTIPVIVAAGEETSEVRLPIARIPREFEVKRFDPKP